VNGATQVKPRQGTLLTKIEDHNRYNGFLFAAIEFGSIAAVTAALAIYFAAVQRWPAALIAAGLAANCTPVAFLALRSGRRGDPQIGYAGLANAKVRQQIGAAHPHLLRDTLTITVLTLIPYAAALKMLAEHGYGHNRDGA
jgi:hypothetical protein